MWLGKQNHDPCYMFNLKPLFYLSLKQNNDRTLGLALRVELLLHVLMFVHSVFCDMRCEGNAGYVICVGSFLKEIYNSDVKNVLSI